MTESTLHIVRLVFVEKVQGKTSGMSAQTILWTSMRRHLRHEAWSVNRDEKPKTAP